MLYAKQLIKRKNTQTQTHRWLSRFGCRLSSVLPGPAGWQTHTVKGHCPAQSGSGDLGGGVAGVGKTVGAGSQEEAEATFVWPQVILSVLCPFPGGARRSYRPGVLTATEIHSLTVPEARSPEARWCGWGSPPGPSCLAAAPAMLSMPRPWRHHSGLCLCHHTASLLRALMSLLRTPAVGFRATWEPLLQEDHAT